MFHQWMSCEDECSTCIRCGGHWMDTDIDEGRVSSCHAEEAEFRTVHGDPDDAGHGFDCAEYAEKDTCKHLASNYDCNCDNCR